MLIFLLLFKICFLIYFWLRWVFLAAHGLSLIAVTGGCSSLQCAGFSCCGAWVLGVWASVVVARGLSSCGAQASLLRGMWDLPQPGIEPVSPALAGGFLTTEPPGKSQILINYKGDQSIFTVKKSADTLLIQWSMLIPQVTGWISSICHLTRCNEKNATSLLWYSCLIFHNLGLNMKIH